MTTQSDTAQMIYEYQFHLKFARGLDDKTIDARLRHVHQFIKSTGDKALKALKEGDVIQFRSEFDETESDNENAVPLSARTIVQTFRNLKVFLEWLKKQKGYGRLSTDLIVYCNPTKRQIALAKAIMPKRVPTPEEIRETLAGMPAQTVKERRDRTFLAFLYLTGVRDGALISLQMKHVDVEERLVFQDAREVNTKFSKTMHTIWFPVGRDIEEIVVAWVMERKNAGALENDPLFPSMSITKRADRSNVSTSFLKSAAPIRKMIQAATKVAGLAYFHPHSLRSTLGLLFFEFAHTPEEQKALSQNLGHEDLVTTLQHYANIAESRQHDLIRQMWDRQELTYTQRLAERLNRMAPEKAGAIERMIDVFDPI